MTSLIVPRFEIGLVDSKGNISREWYKFFALLAKSTPSTTNTDDLQQLVESLDIAEPSAAQDVADGQTLALETEVASVPNDDALMLILDTLDSGVAASPTAKVGIVAVNGSAATLMRSDAAPPLDLTMTVTWTGQHTFTPSGAVTAITINAKSGQAGIQVNGNGNGAAARLASGSGAVALFVDNTAQGVGTAAIRADSTATTGAKTASFTAANKPGTTNVTTPAQWIPVILDAVTYYVPAFAA